MSPIFIWLLFGLAAAITETAILWSEDRALNAPRTKVLGLDVLGFGVILLACGVVGAAATVLTFFLNKFAYGHGWPHYIKGEFGVTNGGFRDEIEEGWRPLQLGESAPDGMEWMGGYWCVKITPKNSALLTPVSSSEPK